MITLGTRGSDLALTQTRHIQSLLASAHPSLEVRIEIIRTIGDDRLELSNPGGLDKGLFTKQLEEALLADTIDAAIHSLKDLPVELLPGLALAAIPERADPSDVLVSKFPGGLAGLPVGATVATSSARRVAIVHHLRPDVKIAGIRGNVPTRLRKLAENPEWHALVLAKAGLDRLGDIVPDGLLVSVEPGILPAPGQGALGIECRAGDSQTRNLFAPLHHDDTARCVTAERALLQSLGGGCAIPLGALASLQNNQIVLKSIFFP